jgi:hypothetical protein
MAKWQMARRSLNDPHAFALPLTLKNKNMAITGKRKSVIKDFENYIITQDGLVYHRLFDTCEWGYVNCLTARVDRAGYFTCRLSKGGHMYTKFLHRLIAEHFVNNPKGYPIVNHLDGDVKNNDPSNLEWTTYSGNTLHAYKIGLIRKRGRAVLNEQSGRLYNTVIEAAQDIGVKYTTLINYLNGRRSNPTFLKYA